MVNAAVLFALCSHAYTQLGRIPALTDTFTDGKPIRLFESGSIMQYLVDRYDTEHKISYPRDSREHVEVS